MLVCSLYYKLPVSVCVDSRSCPGIARDAHVAALAGTIELALSRSGLSSVAEVDAVAVTVGPGLEICLRIGCEEAKRLAAEHQKPFVAVHHLEAHVLMVYI